MQTRTFLHTHVQLPAWRPRVLPSSEDQRSPMALAEDEQRGWRPEEPGLKLLMKYVR